MDKFEEMLGNAIDAMVDEEMEIREREKESYNQALEDLLSKVKSNHYLLSDKINSTDYGMFTCGIEQAIGELKR